MWTKTSEMKPAERTYVLGWFPERGDAGAAIVVERIGDTGMYEDYSGFGWEEPSHWMPLPEAPEPA